MLALFVHNIDPVILQVGGIALWWYGLSYSLGFLGLFFWLRRNRDLLPSGIESVYQLTVLIAAGVLAGGRLVEVFFYEWSYYGNHHRHIPAVWLGGMSTHGILLGAILAILLWCRWQRRRFLGITDLLAIPAAYIMGVGRIGNFIDGQILGSVTGVWWAVQFPDAEGFRHPVVLYDGLKNLLLIPLLLLLLRRRPPRGTLTGHFILWYGFLRIFIDFFREYRVDFLGFPPGQEFNLFMTLAGIALLLWSRRYRLAGEHGISSALQGSIPAGAIPAIKFWRLAFLVLLLVPLVIPSDWTQDVPARYGARHPGLAHSRFYPPLPAAPAEDP